VLYMRQCTYLALLVILTFRFIKRSDRSEDSSWDSWDRPLSAVMNSDDGCNSPLLITASESAMLISDLSALSDSNGLMDCDVQTRSYIAYRLDYSTVVVLILDA
jgi:hypothetical protein